jgi:hypothetical protein
MTLSITKLSIMAHNKMGSREKISIDVSQHNDTQH